MVYLATLLLLCASAAAAVPQSQHGWIEVRSVDGKFNLRDVPVNLGARMTTAGGCGSDRCRFTTAPTGPFLSAGTTIMPPT